MTLMTFPDLSVNVTRCICWYRSLPICSEASLTVFVLVKSSLWLSVTPAFFRWTKAMLVAHRSTPEHSGCPARMGGDKDSSTKLENILNIFFVCLTGDYVAGSNTVIPSRLQYCVIKPKVLRRFSFGRVSRKKAGAAGWARTQKRPKRRKSRRTAVSLPGDRSLRRFLAIISTVIAP